jgi:outer membrane protein assembly factor BamB
MKWKSFLLLVLLIAWNLSAQSPDWPCFRGNPLQTGVTNANLAEQLAPVWTYLLDGGLEATAAIAGNAVYAGSSDGTFVSLNLDTGKENWKYQAGDEIKSSPAVDRGVVYFGDEKGTLHALDTLTGQKKFTFQADAAITASPAIYEDHILVGSYDQNLYCLKPDGAVSWKAETAGYVNGTPAIWNGNAVVTGCDGFVRLIQISDRVEKHKIKVGNYIGASPAIYGDHAYFGTFGNQVLSVDLKQFKVSWQYENPEAHFPYYSSAAVTSTGVYIGGRDKYLHALNPETGKELWKFLAKSKVDSSPVVSGDKVFFGTVGGQVFGLAADSGKVVWQYDAADPVVSSPAVVEGKLVIGTKNGTLLCFGQQNKSS